MAFTVALLVTTLTFFSSTFAFSPDQCNATSYGTPNKAACSTLLTSISKLGEGDSSYLFIPSQFPTPAGLSNGTRKNFPQSWSTTGCKVALVPIEVTNTSVTYDTSTYQDLAAAGTIIVQQCVSNKTGAGGWELAGDNEDLVLHLYAAGSEIDKTVNQQTSTEIAATSEDEIDDAEMDDPVYNSNDYGDDDINGDAYNGTGLGNGTNSVDSTGNSTGGSTGGSAGTGTGTGTGSGSQVSAPSTQVSPAVSAAKVVSSSGTFSYLGCQLDSDNARTLSSLSWSGTGLTVERCAAYCTKYQYMGVEFGSQCYCGGDANGKGVKPATLVTSTTNNCTMPCNGDATQLCGGEGWLNMYQNSNSATAGATA